MFSGYYKNIQKTKEVLSQDGWFSSGDFGIILPNGSLKILDRVSNVYFIGPEAYISPEKLERIYQNCPML